MEVLSLFLSLDLGIFIDRNFEIEETVYELQFWVHSLLNRFSENDCNFMRKEYM